MLILLTTALAWTPTTAEEALVRALSSRDGAPPCEEVEQNLADPVASLTKVVEHVEMPPWAPMYAAACLIERHPTDANDLMVGWVTDPQKKGLAKLVFNRLHLLDDLAATDLAERSLTGPHQEHARRSMLRSPKVEIRERATR